MAGSRGGAPAADNSRPDPTVRRVALAFVAGVVVVVTGSAVLAAVRPLLLPVGAVGGAAAAGYVARVGRVGGTLLGAVVMAAVGAAGLAAFWFVVTTDPPRTGGAGLGLVVGFLFVAFFVLVGVVLGGLGGLTGAVVRRRHATADAAAAGPGTAHGREPLEQRDPGRPDAVDEGSDAVVPAPRSPDGVDSSVSTVFVGAGLALATCFVPFAPVATGAGVGYLEAAGPRRGAIVAALAGLLATGLLVAGLILFALLPLNILRPFIFEYVPQLTVLLGAYFAGLGAIGGAFGGSMAG